VNPTLRNALQRLDGNYHFDTVLQHLSAERQSLLELLVHADNVEYAAKIKGRILQLGEILDQAVAAVTPEENPDV
jgi:hypothetical protein